MQKYKEIISTTTPVLLVYVWSSLEKFMNFIKKIFLKYCKSMSCLKKVCSHASTGAGTYLPEKLVHAIESVNST